jgi:cytochrome P450
LGLHFAYMQAKVFLHALLKARQLELKPGYEPDWARFPIPRPRDQLPITLRQR